MSDLLNSASLVMVPSGYKEDTIYSVVPSDGSGDLSFTRASNGTRVNSAGLVEVCPWNLLSYSNTFNNGVWVTGGYGNLPTLTANSIANPVNGLVDAWTASFASAGTQGRLLQVFAGLPVGVPYTYSMYVKAGTKTSVTIYSDAASVGLNAVFNLSNGTITSLNGVTATITAMSNGWYYLTITNNILSSGNGQYGIITNTSDDGSMYIYGAQLNIGSTAKPYFPTTDRLNVPRLTYQNGGGGCPSLLLEKQSTNLAPYSEDATQWGLGSIAGTITVTGNQTTSPDGTQNADKIQFPAVAASSAYAVTYYEFTASAAAYSGTIYLKGNSGGEVVYIMYTPDGSNYTSVACTLTTEWQRFNLTSTLGAGTQYFQIGVDRRDSAQTAKNAQTIFVWGRQLEQSSYPTSYIPTTSSSATRVKDLAYKSGATALIGQTEGVLFCDFNLPSVETSGDYPFIVNIWGNSTNRFGFARYPNGGVHIYMIASTSQFTYNTTQLTGRFKLALGYKANDCVIYLNGTLLQTITSATIPATDDIIFNGINTIGDYNTQLQINQTALFKTRLTNAELASLTTI